MYFSNVHLSNFSVGASSANPGCIGAASSAQIEPPFKAARFASRPENAPEFGVYGENFMKPAPETTENPPRGRADRTSDGCESRFPGIRRSHGPTGQTLEPRFDRIWRCGDVDILAEVSNTRAREETEPHGIDSRSLRSRSLACFPGSFACNRRVIVRNAAHRAAE